MPPPPPGPGSDADARVVERVRKLLAMAERSGHPEEADAFSRKAAELIAAHRLDPARLRAPASGRGGIELVEIDVGRGAYVRARLALLQAVADGHTCSVVWQTGPRGTVALVAGHVDDLEPVRLLYTSLLAQATSRAGREQRATGAATQRWRRTFLFGFATQVHEMLQRTVDDAVRVAGSDVALPALRAREDQVDEFLRRRFDRIASARRPRLSTLDGWDEGRATARRADVGRARIPVPAEIGAGRR